MTENSNNSTNNDILSGKGLKPISSPQSPPKQSGITTENRGRDFSGIRFDRFTKNLDKRGGK